MASNASRTASAVRVPGQVQQPQVAAGAIDHGGDGRLVVTPHDQVTFPVTDPLPPLDEERTAVDQQRWRDEPGSAFVGSAAAFAQRPAGAQPAGQLPAQSTFAAVVERLVDGLLADVPARLIRVGGAKPGGDRGDRPHAHLR